MAETYAAMLDSSCSIESRVSEMLDVLGKRVGSSASAI